MFIAILSVKLKIKTYVQIHKMAVKYWDVIAEGLDLTPNSERQHIAQGPIFRLVHMDAKQRKRSQENVA